MSETVCLSVKFACWLIFPYRSILLKYENETWTQDIPTWKFSVPAYSMLNGTAYPPNAGFCLPDIDHCLPSGLLNVSKCQLGKSFVLCYTSLHAEWHSLSPNAGFCLPDIDHCLPSGLLNVSKCQSFVLCSTLLYAEWHILSTLCWLLSSWHWSLSS